MSSEYLLWCKENSSRHQFIDSLKLTLTVKAKTKPIVVADRLATILRCTYEELDADPYILDCIYTAIEELKTVIIKNMNGQLIATTSKIDESRLQGCTIMKSITHKEAKTLKHVTLGKRSKIGFSVHDPDLFYEYINNCVQTY